MTWREPRITKKAAREPLENLRICARWAFTTMNEALGFVRRRMKGADG